MTTPGDAILTALQANTVCTALVYGGAAGMIDAGKLTVPWLSAQEDARKAAESTAILAVIVRDGGEVAGTNNISHVYVGLYDRKQGNTKLKPAMQQVI